jgi:hypothetical protein
LSERGYGHSNNEIEEALIVSRADAVVQPNTMMVEILGASIASKTMFASFQYIRITFMAEELDMIIVNHQAILRAKANDERA